MQRRETERQTEMRLKSYSYHAQQEEHEPWVDLEVIDVSGEVAPALSVVEAHESCV